MSVNMYVYLHTFAYFLEIHIFIPKSLIKMEIIYLKCHSMHVKHSTVLGTISAKLIFYVVFGFAIKLLFCLFHSHQ